MELTELFKIFQRYYKLFFGIVISFVVLGGIAFLLQPSGYKAALTLNISRSAAPMTSEYTYDDFYRLQADERFADTVVRWLTEPRVVSDVFSLAGVDTQTWSERRLSGVFNARRLSSQVISVRYSMQDISSAQRLSVAIKDQLNAETKKLNALQQEKSWFVILGDDPVITPSERSLSFFLLIALIVGVFAAFWGVVLRGMMKD